MSVRVRSAVILARGLGTRMRSPDPDAGLSGDQAAAADVGLKAMIPVGRPFLDYVLSALADAGIERACLVIGPEHDRVRDHYARLRPTRIEVSFAVQAEPRGTADAVLSAERFADGQPVLVLNSDNYYPASVLRAMRGRAAAAAGFDRDALVEGGNIPPERIASYALLDVAPDGTLRRVVEKPDAAALAELGPSARVSMNCWTLPPAIYEACRAIRPSARGELELPQAVQHAVDVLGVRFEVVPAAAGVLDLSRRGDIPAVTARLREIPVSL